MKEQKIVKLSEIEHVLKRKSMYFGNFSLESSEQFYLKGDKFTYGEIKRCPALLKTIYEVLDNSIDESIRTKFKYANKIEIEITEGSFKVKDNGRGIPVKKAPCGTYQPVLAWTSLRTSGNYDVSNSTTIGINGVGASCSAIFSKKFRAVTSDGKNKLILNCSNNLSNTDFSISSNKQQYTEVYSELDFSHFEVKKIDKTHINLIKQRLIGLSLLYPIKFILNGEEIKYNKSLDDYCKLFGDNYCALENKNLGYSIILFSNDDFESQQYLTYSMLNGLEISSGSHFDFIENKLLTNIKNELSKKKETRGLTLSDIKNNFLVVLLMRDFKNADYKSQTKEELAVKKEHLINYFDDNDFNKITRKVIKDKNLIEPIIDNFKMKLQIKEMRDIKAKDKKLKKKSDKPTKLIEANSKNREQCELFIVEGDSAKTNFLPTRDCNYQACFPLKGKPLNVIKKSMKEIYSNAEIKELLSIIGVGLLDMAVEFEGWSKRFLKIKLNNNRNIIVNENDKIKINDKWKSARLLTEEKEVKHIEEYELQLKEFTVNKDLIKRKISKNNLRYGKLLLLADQDEDGKDIIGLLLGLFTTYFPEIFEGEILHRINSPLFILSNKKERLRFYSIKEYKDFISKNQNKLNKYETRYVKGLAGLSENDYTIILNEDFCRELFSYETNRDYKEILKSYGNKHIRERKDWLLENN